MVGTDRGRAGPAGQAGRAGAPASTPEPGSLRPDTVLGTGATSDGKFGALRCRGGWAGVSVAGGEGGSRGGERRAGGARRGTPHHRDRADTKGLASKGKPTPPVRLSRTHHHSVCSPAKRSLDASNLAKAFSKHLLCADMGQVR